MTLASRSPLSNSLRQEPPPASLPSCPEALAQHRAQHRQLQFEVARYIELLLGELSTMAKAADLTHLRHFLELTRQEACDQTNRCARDC